MHIGIVAVLLLLAACASQQIELPPPPEAPPVVIDDPTCVSCGSLLDEEQLAHLVDQGQQGNAQAAFRVGFHYSSADQPELHHKWSRQAALLGHPVAQYNEWFLLRQSSSCADRKEALEWLRKSAAQGDSDALRELPVYSGQLKNCGTEQGGSSGGAA